MMKVALSSKYRIWMLVLLPTTLGLGTIALWAFSLNWPLSVGANGVTLRHRRMVPWKSIRTISVSRDYFDGHVSRIHIHCHSGNYKVPLRALHDGDKVAEIILAKFKESRQECQVDQSVDIEAAVYSRNVDGKIIAASEPRRSQCHEQINSTFKLCDATPIDVFGRVTM